MAGFIDLTGQRFERLVVVSRATNNDEGSARWNCLCDCGGTTIALCRDLRSGNTHSCGCFCKDRIREVNSTHGMSETSTYSIWKTLRQRCANPNDPAYKNYGGRGITVCDRWNRFENFYEDMGERPSSMSIDRRDNNGNYCPENCSWETRKNQNRNARSNVTIKYDGKTQCMAAWAEELCVDYETLRRRLKRHPPQIAFNM